MIAYDLDFNFNAIKPGIPDWIDNIEK